MALDVLHSFDVPLGILEKLGTRMSDEELIRFSEDNLPYRFERNMHGEITIMSPVGGTSSIHEGLVFGALYAWTQRDGRGVAFAPNAGFKLSDGSCLAPDGAWIHLSRWNRLDPREQAGFPPLCPDFLIEVRSLSDPRQPLDSKMEQWLANGAQLAWLIDPILSSVTIYQPGQKPQTLESPGAVAGTGPVAGFELPCNGLWSPR